MQTVFYICIMPLLLRKQVAAGTEFAIWEIAESHLWFRAQLFLNEEENELINDIRSQLKQLHCLSSRLLLRILLNDPDIFIYLRSDERGKPVVQNFPVNISISHSVDYSVLLLSDSLDVGVDIEKID